MNSKNDKIRGLQGGINEFKRATNLEVTEWKNYSQLLNVHNVSGISPIEIHTTEPLVPDPGSFEAEIAFAKLKSIYCQIAIRLWWNWFKQ
jgi:hypothetical protein